MGGTIVSEPAVCSAEPVFKFERPPTPDKAYVKRCGQIQTYVKDDSRGYCLQINADPRFFINCQQALIACPFPPQHLLRTWFPVFHKNLQAITNTRIHSLDIRYDLKGNRTVFFGHYLQATCSVFADSFYTVAWELTSAASGYTIPPNDPRVQTTVVRCRSSSPVPSPRKVPCLVLNKAPVTWRKLPRVLSVILQSFRFLIFFLTNLERRADSLANHAALQVV
ncbi:hypothetical protein PoB_006690100 [Plakobranchus ocellatus]|uniref:Uncharacterized protein n=1 Tax=Plakobranchus ocellatus TaxID=259542 RepID=A0AAV4D8Y1_9GAST|nr:hypothetical protein PoB_006690100 [Plakobranchus ocellatus]